MLVDYSYPAEEIVPPHPRVQFNFNYSESCRM